MPDPVHKQRRHVCFHLIQDWIRLHDVCPGIQRKQRFRWSGGAGVKCNYLCLRRAPVKERHFNRHHQPVPLRVGQLEFPQETTLAAGRVCILCRSAPRTEWRTHRKRKSVCGSPARPNAHVRQASSRLHISHRSTTVRLRVNSRSAANALSCRGGSAGGMSVPAPLRARNRQRSQRLAARELCHGYESNAGAAPVSSTIIDGGIRRGILQRSFEGRFHGRGGRTATAIGLQMQGGL